MTLIQGAGGSYPPFAEDRHIFPSVGREAAEAVEKLEFRSRWEQPAARHSPQTSVAAVERQRASLPADA